MRGPLLIKISFWLLLIGFVALITPNPAWPEWLARIILSTGIALALTTLGMTIFGRNKNDSKQDE
jgi:membrane protein implicated in regulation of membrane protease activity